MDYTQLTVNDEVTVLRNKIREAEAQHFAHTTDLQTLSALGIENEEVETIRNAVTTLEAQVAFLNQHLDALIAFAAEQEQAE